LSSGENLTIVNAGDQLKDPAAASGYDQRTILLVAILLFASVIRLFHLGQSSLWYDEVVTMRLARTENPAALCRLLSQIDATRAPLHPLLLQGWITLFGHSDTSGRGFSVLCGIVTVGVVYWIGFQAFNATTGIWASWLCALSPLLVYYSREIRMYMWLVVVTCVAWGLLFSHARSPHRAQLVLYALALICMVYSHPLGLLMVVALGMASSLFHRALQISWRGWLYIHLAVVLAIAPWVGQYLDHAPESTSGVLPLRYLLGMPIGFIGGNFLVLLVCSLLIAYGLCEVRWRKPEGIRIVLEHPVPSICLLIWLTAPSVLLYAYSRVAHPIFGPPRYTLFVGPAYLLLVALGLGKLPWPLGIMAAVAGAIISVGMLLNSVYRPDLKADWKDVAAYLDRRDPDAVVVVISGDSVGDMALETARYYFGPGRFVIPWRGRPGDLMNRQVTVWASISLQDGRPMDVLPAELTTDKLIREVVDFSRLRLMRVDFHQASPPGE
jgi:mannosyltransferase